MSTFFGKLLERLPNADDLLSLGPHHRCIAFGIRVES